MSDDDGGLLSPRETCRLAGGISRSTLERRVRAGKFPPPISLGDRTDGRASRIAWVKAEVLAWCSERIVADRSRRGTRAVDHAGVR